MSHTYQPTINKPDRPTDQPVRSVESPQQTQTDQPTYHPAGQPASQPNQSKSTNHIVTVLSQVAARYMLVQHRDVVHELFHHGHINEREFEGLIAQNNTARVKLDYHPTADQIPDRYGCPSN